MHELRLGAPDGSHLDFWRLYIRHFHLDERGLVHVVSNFLSFVFVESVLVDLDRLQ